MENEQTNHIINEVLQAKPDISLSVDFSKKVQFKAKKSLLLRLYLRNFFEVLLATIIVAVVVFAATFFIDSETLKTIINVIQNHHATILLLLFCIVSILFIDKVLLKFATFWFRKDFEE